MVCTGILLLYKAMNDSNNTSSTTKTRRRFPRISSSAFEHPADKAALDVVKSIPFVDKVFKRFFELG